MSLSGATFRCASTDEGACYCMDMLRFGIYIPKQLAMWFLCVKHQNCVTQSSVMALGSKHLSHHRENLG